MNQTEIAARIEAIKTTLDRAFDEGKIDFDAIGNELEAIKTAVEELKVASAPHPVREETAVQVEEYR